VAYATLTTGTLMFVGRRMIGVIESKNQAESELKYVFANLRQRYRPAVGPPTSRRRPAEAGLALGDVIHEWRNLAWQYMRTTYVSTAIRCWRRWPG
jgi:putative ATP-binding cassette transporter